MPIFVAANPEYKDVHSQVRQDVFRRLDRAFQNFFDGIAGYPKFKDRDHYRSFTYPQVDAVAKTFGQSGCIFLSNIGFVKLNAHREFPADLVSQANVKFDGQRWHVQLTAEVEEPETVERIMRSTGVDLGLIHFAAYSDGTLVPNPRYLRQYEKRLKRAQRQLSHKKKGSHNRGKAKAKLAHLHRKVANQREDFLHKVSVDLVRNYDLIVMEDLKINNMAKNHKLAKSIMDAGWGTFQTLVEYKAKKFGKKFMLVNPAGTSQTCVCGAAVPKDLKVRVHKCAACGLVEDRDVVSARVIEKRGLAKSAAWNRQN